MDKQLKTTLAWVSRHPPLKTQIKALQAKLGDIEIIEMPEKQKNAEAVISKLKHINAKYAVLVLPLTVIQHILNTPESKGIAFIRAEMAPCNEGYNPDSDVLTEDGDGLKRHRRFREFRIMTEITVVTLPFEEVNLL